MQLSERERKIILFINEYIKTFGSSPTEREIGAYIGVSYPLINHHLCDLENEGYIIKRHKNVGEIKILKMPV